MHGLESAPTPTIPAEAAQGVALANPNELHPQEQLQVQEILGNTLPGSVSFFTSTFDTLSTGDIAAMKQRVTERQIAAGIENPTVSRGLENYVNGWNVIGDRDAFTDRQSNTIMQSMKALNKALDTQPGSYGTEALGFYQLPPTEDGGSYVDVRYMFQPKTGYVDSTNRESRMWASFVLPAESAKQLFSMVEQRPGVIENVVKEQALAMGLPEDKWREFNVTGRNNLAVPVANRRLNVAAYNIGADGRNYQPVGNLVVLNQDQGYEGLEPALGASFEQVQHPVAEPALTPEATAYSLPPSAEPEPSVRTLEAPAIQHADEVYTQNSTELQSTEPVAEESTEPLAIEAAEGEPQEELQQELTPVATVSAETGLDGTERPAAMNDAFWSILPDATKRAWNNGKIHPDEQKRLLTSFSGFWGSLSEADQRRWGEGTMTAEQKATLYQQSMNLNVLQPEAAEPQAPVVAPAFPVMSSFNTAPAAGRDFLTGQLQQSYAGLPQQSAWGFASPDYKSKASPVASFSTSSGFGPAPAYGTAPSGWEGLASAPGYGNNQLPSSELTKSRVEAITGREIASYFGSLGGFALKGVGATLKAAVRPGRGFVEDALNNGLSSAVTKHKLEALRTGVNAFEHAHNTNANATATAAKMDALLNEHLTEVGRARGGY